MADLPLIYDEQQQRFRPATAPENAAQVPPAAAAPAALPAARPVAISGPEALRIRKRKRRHRFRWRPYFWLAFAIVAVAWLAMVVMAGSNWPSLLQSLFFGREKSPVQIVPVGGARK